MDSDHISALAVLFVTGGGVSGICAALRDSERGQSIVTVALDLTDHTRAALLDGTINFLISHPLQTLAQETIAAMVRTFDGGPNHLSQSISLPFEIYTSENL